MTSVPSQRAPSAYASARATAPAFIGERRLARTISSPYSPQASPSAEFSAVPHPAVSPSPLNEPVLAASPIVSTMPIRHSSILPSATVAATRPISRVHAILANTSTRAPPLTVPHASLSVPPDALTTAIVSPVPVLPMATSPAPISTASMPVSSALTVDRQFSPKHAVVNHQSSAPNPVAFNTLPQTPVIALLRGHLARHDAKFAVLDEALIARKDCVLQL